MYEDKDTLLTLSINYRNVFLIFKKPEKEGSQRMTIVTRKLRILSFKSTDKRGKTETITEVRTASSVNFF